MRRYMIQTTDTIERIKKIHIVETKNVKEALIKIGVIPKQYTDKDNFSIGLSNSVEISNIYSEEI